MKFILTLLITLSFNVFSSEVNFFTMECINESNPIHTMKLNVVNNNLVGVRILSVSKRETSLIVYKLPKEGQTNPEAISYNLGLSNVVLSVEKTVLNGELGNLFVLDEVLACKRIN